MRQNTRLPRAVRRKNTCCELDARTARDGSGFPAGRRSAPAVPGSQQGARRDGRAEGAREGVPVPRIRLNVRTRTRLPPHSQYPTLPSPCTTVCSSPEWSAQHKAYLRCITLPHCPRRPRHRAKGPQLGLRRALVGLRSYLAANSSFDRLKRRLPLLLPSAPQRLCHNGCGRC